jgi:hypothetical protein
MKKLKQPAAISLSLLIFLLFTACSKQNYCKGSYYTPKTFNYLLDDSTKVQIPYTGKETLTFISSQGDTAILVGQGKNNYMKKTTKNSVTSMDCPEYDNYNFERVDVEYKGSNFNLSYVFYRVEIDNWKDENTSVYLNENFSDSHLAYTEYYNSTSRYDLQVQCGSKIIMGVKIYGGNNNPIIYNKLYGIIQIQIDSNLVYTLNL